MTLKMNNQDMGLFGEPALPYPPPHPRKETLLGQWARVAGYRKADSKERRCKTCRFQCDKQMGRVYHKCKVLGCTSSKATDIRVNHVCMWWRSKIGSEEQEKGKEVGSNGD